ncbi:arogenate dehydrogenase 2, chloroplastic-like [Dioscorea cayenensis subsp. rotundata]|uniref:Arogenate dehydrogenase 2, chloroplastic-like n=1 Tax=Dioscorea cayennensis subsp. rotundata TaxID=55577 RepID=A0AB40CWC4_DIOCR|nr:arogenate dehydrogenase 2, chloroplastic-like [Dioscorea cayenensis subsp. rotundata]
MASSSFHLYAPHHIKAIPKITIIPSTKSTTLSYPTTTTTTTTTTIIKNKAHTFGVGALRSNNGVKPLEPSSEVNETPLKIAIIGFGNFGQFIAKGIQRQGHAVLAFSRSDYSEYCDQNGIKFFKTLEGLCNEEPDIVLVCSSILSTESVMLGIPFHKLKPDTIFADVLSVKQYPRNLFLEVLPPEFGIVCTHPMFGPESGRHGWGTLPFVYDEVRILKGSTQAQKCAQFLSIFQKEGCRMVEMSCEEHDRHAAGTQFITHTIGRILSQLNLESTPINTKGYETLLQLTENTVSDSFDLYYGLFMYNVNATEQIDNLDKAFEIVKQKLFGRLHGILRKQIVERVPMQRFQRSIPDGKPASYFLPDNKKMNGFSSFAMPPEPAEKLSKEQEDEKDKATISSRFPF